MHPIICTIGPLTIYAFGLMLALAFFVAVFLAMRYARRIDLDEAFAFNFAFTVFIAGVLGARLFYILQHASYYIRYPQDMALIQKGGLAWYGGLLAAIITALVYVHKKRQRLLEVLDFIVPFVALGQAIGRIGCLLNGCCYGKPAEAGIFFPVHNAVLIPTQAYSTIGLLAIFIVLRWAQQRPHRTGLIFCGYLMLYSLKRFIIEFFRADNTVIFAGLTLFQLLSLIMFSAAVIAIIRIRTRGDIPG
jgi:phosphatidylglycerol:prolipoprotein diacylglycerol transferase